MSATRITRRAGESHRSYLDRMTAAARRDRPKEGERRYVDQETADRGRIAELERENAVLRETLEWGRP